MVNINKALGERIRKIRKEKDITQEELAWRAEMDFSVLNEIENGKGNPTIETVAKIAKGLGVKVESLFSF